MGVHSLGWNECFASTSFSNGIASLTKLSKTPFMTAKLLHGQENQVNGDAGYVGIEKRKEITEEDPNGRIDWQIAKKRGAIKKMEEGPEKELIVAEEKAKASVRAFVEPSFHILKNLFRHRKTRYRGLAKNHH